MLLISRIFFQGSRHKWGDDDVGGDDVFGDGVFDVDLVDEEII